MEPNPYEAANTMPQVHFGRLAPTPIQYMMKSYRLMGDKYWLFLGIVICGFIIGSLIPLGVLLGPMFTGIYLCFLDREAGNEVKFDVLFRGFDHFVPSLLVTLTMLLCNIIISTVFFVLALLCVFGVVGVMQSGNGGPAVPTAILAVGAIVGYGLLLAVTILTFLPFAFCFQLIAEHKMSAGAAMSTSTRAVLHNLWPLALTFISFSFFGIAAALLCYFPAFFLMPIQIGATFIVYREIFPRT
jgi:hypothetical protein